MLYLKIFLSTVLVFCFIWGILIFAGPYLIERNIHSKYGDKIKLSNVTVLPNLQINVGTMDFQLTPKDNTVNFGGSLRAISIDWSIFSKKPYVRLSFGPSRVDTVGRVRSGYIELTPDQLTVPHAGQLTIVIDHPEVVGWKKIERIQFMAGYENYPPIIDNGVVKFDVGQINDNLILDGLTATIDNFNLGNSLAGQSFNITVEASSISSAEPQLTFSAHDLSGQLEWVNGNALLKTFLNEVAIEFEKFEINISGLSSETFTNGDFSLAESAIRVDEVLIDESEFFVEAVNASVNAKANHLIAKIDANLKSWEVVVGENYLGLLKDGSFNSSIKISWKDELLINSALSASIEAFPEIDLSAQALVSMLGDQSLSDCLLIEKCLLDEVLAEYRLTLGDQNMSGKAECPSSPCRVTSAKHTVRTTDTSKLFSNLSNAKIFNPVFLALLYSQFLAGDISGSGHQITF